MADKNENDMTTRLMFEQIREDIKKLGEGYEDLKRQLSEDTKTWAGIGIPNGLRTISRSGTTKHESGSWNVGGPATAVVSRA